MRRQPIQPAMTNYRLALFDCLGMVEITVGGVKEPRDLAPPTLLRHSYSKASKVRG